MGIQGDDKRVRFLDRIGKTVLSPRQLNVNDIVGVISESDLYIKIRNVEDVHKEPNFVKFDYFPFARFYKSYFGFNVNENLEMIGYKFVSVSPQRSNHDVWRLYSIDENLSHEKQESQQTFIENFCESETEIRVYRVESDYWVNLGNILPLIELPNLSFLSQSLDLEEVVKRTKESQKLFEELKELSEKMRKTLSC